MATPIAARHYFEAGPNAGTITTAGADGEQSWDTKNNTGTNVTSIYDTTHAYGTYAAKLGTGASSQSNYFEWSTTINGGSTVQNHCGRALVYLTANPTAAMQIYSARTSGAAAAGIAIKTDGKIELRDNGGVARATSTNAIGLNQFVRLEWNIVHSATVGQITVRIYNSPDAAVASYTEEIATAATINTTAGASVFRIGIITTGANQPSSGKFMWLDGVAEGGTDWFGRVYTAGAPYAVGTSDTIGEALMVCGTSDVSLAAGTHTLTETITRAKTGRLVVNGNGVSVPKIIFANCRGLILDGVNLSSSGSTFDACSDITIRNQTASVDTDDALYELHSSANDITIEDSTLSGGTWCIRTSASTGSQTNWPQNLVVQRCDISGAVTDCIQINGLKSDLQADGFYGSRIIDNMIHDPVIDLSGAAHNDGIQGIGVNGLTIARNEIYCANASSLNGPNQGIIIGHADPKTATQTVSNVDVFSNLVHHWQGGSGITFSGTTDCRLANNTSVLNGTGSDHGFSISAKSNPTDFDNTGLEVWNNIFDKEQLVSGSSQPDYHDYNLIYPNGTSGVTLGSHDLTSVDPEFIDEVDFIPDPLVTQSVHGSNRSGTPARDVTGDSYPWPTRGAQGLTTNHAATSKTSLSAGSSSAGTLSSSPSTKGTLTEV